MAAGAEVLDGLYLNTAVIAGTISQYGVKTRFQDNGSQHTSFAVMVKERGFDEKVRTTYFDIECWGKAAEVASSLEAHQPVIVEGKLVRSKRQRKGEAEQWTTTIQGYRIQVLGEEAP